MVRIIKPMRFDRCVSCGEVRPHLLRSFDLGKKDGIVTNITLCTDCLGDLIQQEILYQPEGEENEFTNSKKNTE